jgi:glucokinase
VNRDALKICCGDVGGTKTRLAVAEVSDEGVRLLIEAVYPSRSYLSFEELLHKFIDDHAKGMSWERSCFGIAGPVRAGRCQATNLPWTVDAKLLSARLGDQEVALLNDLEAIGYGIRGLHDDDVFVLNEGYPDGEGNGAVIAAGTGLGEAGLYRHDRHFIPFATEGGHASFSPASELEFALLQYLAKDYGHVSWERVVSGPGLVNIYQFLREYRCAEEPAALAEDMKRGDPAAVISNAALSGSSDLCIEALDMFIHLYGAEAGNQALKLMATGGLYIGGGIAPKILTKLKDPAFMGAFCAKGRMAPLLAAMPVKVIINVHVSVFGPAIFAAGPERWQE